MLTKDFDFELPKELIAQHPSAERGNDRLLVLNRATGALTDALFSDLPGFLPSDCLMVFNNTKVRHARVYAHAGGAEIEFLLIEPLDEGFVWKTLVKRAKRQREGKEYTFPDGTCAVLIPPPSLDAADADCKYLRFNRCIDDRWLEANGHIPLPPYIKRGDTDEDAARYQTVYAKNTGSVAAPTAGLHFTDEILRELDERHIPRTAVTLHVGLGTFLPVRTDVVEDHSMHTEKFFISDETAHTVDAAHRNGKTVLAVGTTSVRTLESAWDAETQRLRRGAQSTNIFIYPGFTFGLTGALLTNFHTPQSSLVMLVSAFAGRENIFAAYHHAIEKKYRFFSYGDAMLIL
ncbi:MAG: tRNA preQ1(34) S-adenosylmethionine ribosyltransferase-isomerase QueA [Treponema sp.]|uniref:tRNA preQ1(34) S-adenosylmethionine ribosyltransferase-isomerase QueA n=1 Tax=Treponema sp. TaxID=166 RepID=UPI003FA33DDA